MARPLPGDKPLRSSIALALLSTCDESRRMEVGVQLLMGVKTPDMCVDVMAAGRMIHGHGVLLSECVPMMEREDV